MTNLVGAMAPASREKLLDAFRAKQLCYLPGAIRDIVGSFGWENVNHLVSYGQIENPRLRVSHNNIPLEQLLRIHKRVPTRRQTYSEIIQNDNLKQLLEDGGTLIIDKLEAVDPVVRSWVKEIARSFGLRVQANFYGSLGSEPGFGLHWDDHDVLVCNFDGEKRWQIWAPTRASPTFRDTEGNPEPVGEPIFEQLLDAGDVLFIPRGFWHNVVGVDKPSAHISFGFEVFNGLELVRRILDDELRGELAFRMDAPFWEGKVAQQNFLRSLQNAISRRLLETTVLDELKQKQLRTPPYPQVSLPWLATHTPIKVERYLFEWQPIYQLEFEENNGELAFECFGKKFRFASATLGVFKLWQEKINLTFEEVSMGLGEHIARESVVRFLHSLSEAGIIALVQDKP